MLVAGISTYIWDGRYIQSCHQYICNKLRQQVHRSRLDAARLDCAIRGYATDFDAPPPVEKPLPPLPRSWPGKSPQQSLQRLSGNESNSTDARLPSPSTANESEAEIPAMTWQLGSLILLTFGLAFIAIITIHILLPHLQRTFQLFSSLLLAGTVIFGGGPVVIPLLNTYIVSPGWVSPRDFLLGVAVIQAFPGPNFNFVVYLGALAVQHTRAPSFLGAAIAFLAMYTPGLAIVVGFTGLWRLISEKRWFLAVLRGVNAAAVGLIFTAVYKLWQIGRLTAEFQGGSPLGGDPWLVMITATAYVGGAWFGVNAPVAILAGGTLGIVRWCAIDA
ncbi:MAG: hypothetical protein OHK93_004059 [Ramalina farinacea]|uniref:Chromate transporter n=1 Tax=Ramalina farinacea TaxID=258253 RepID=A0AA43QKA8_9LECA|nr:hypothetical protein [Ramalina farinacea]